MLCLSKSTTFNTHLEAWNDPRELDGQGDADDGAAAPECDGTIAQEILLRPNAREDVSPPERLVNVPRHDRRPEEGGEHAEVDQDGGHLACHAVGNHFHIVGRKEDDLEQTYS